MKILFVTYDLGYTENIGITFLSSIAKQLGHSTYYCVIDQGNFLSKIKQIKPEIVGYSANIYVYKQIVEAHKKARKTYDFVSIMGGPHPTICPESYKESKMDAYCLGEGEYAFQDFLKRVEKGRPFDDIENIVTKKGVNPVRPLIQNLDELPMPDRDLILSSTHLAHTPKKTFFTSRGCPFSCAYCCNNFYHKLYQGKGKFVRRFSVNRVLKEMENVKNKYRMDFVKIDDDCFAIKADSWLEEFAEKYPKKIGIPFNCVLRFDNLDDKILELLKEAGCFSVHLSVDSTSDYVRENILKRRMRKNIDIAKILKRISQYGINTWVNYMLAIPESTWQDDLNTISLSKKGKVTYPSYTTTVPLVGTELYNYCLKNKLIRDYSYHSEIPSFYKKSSLSCFDEKEKNIRQNINLLGALTSKLPFPIDKFVIASILVLPPNKFFKKIHDLVFDYYISNKIYNFPKDRQCE